MTAPDQVGSYLIQRKIGEGGMGAIYEGVHESLGRHVAIKILHPEYGRQDDLTARLFNEARTISQLEHPGLVQVFDFGRLPDGTTYIVMELLKGQSLGARLRDQGRLPLTDVLRLAWQIANALATVHAHGVIHRDLKPDNVFLVKDPIAPGGIRAKVLDFGLAKVAERPAGQVKTRSDILMGTPAYMSPEQCRGAGAVTDKSDVYALGVMLYEMLSGRLPFMSDGMGELISMHIHSQPPSLSKAMPELPKEVSELVHRLLAKDKDERPAILEVIMIIEQVAASCAPGAIPNPGASAEVSAEDALKATMAGVHKRPSTLGNSTGQKRSRRPRRAAGLVWAIGLLAVIGGGMMMWSNDRRHPAAPAVTQPVSTAALPSLVPPPPVAPPPPPVAPPPPPVEPPPPKDEPPATTKLVRWAIRSQPAGATITELPSGEVLGRTPMDRALPAKSGLIALTLQLPGYADLALSVAGDRDAQLKVKLQRWTGDDPKKSSAPSTARPPAQPPKQSPAKDPAAAPPGFKYEE